MLRSSMKLNALALIGLAACGSSLPHDPVPTADLSAAVDMTASDLPASDDLSFDLASLPTPTTLYASPEPYFIAKEPNAGLLYAYRVGVGTAGLHIASIALPSGVLTSLVDDDGYAPPLDVQVANDRIYWLAAPTASAANFILRSASLSGNDVVTELDATSLIGRPTGTTILNFDASSNGLFVAIGNYGASVEVGKIGQGYDKLATVTYPGATYVAAEERGTMSFFAGKLYLSLYASYPPDAGTAGNGFLAQVDPLQKSFLTFGVDGGHILSVVTDATRVMWRTQSEEVEGIVPPSLQPGPIGVLPNRTSTLDVANGELYGVAIAHHAYTLDKTTLPAHLDGSAITTPLATVSTCLDADMACHTYVPTIANDGTNAYYSTPDGIYSFPL